MRRVIPLLVLLFFLLPPKVAGDPKPFIAVFCNPGFKEEWKDLPVDYLYEPETWQDFKIFCKEVKKRSEGRGVLMDVDTHGLDNLYLQYTDDKLIEHTYMASMGYVCATIERELPKQVLELDLEACNGGKVYRSTIRNNHRSGEPGDVIEDYNSIPEYPVMGLASGINYSNATFLQRVLNHKITLEDLRIYELKKVGGENPLQDEALKLFITIYQLSQSIKNN